MQLTYDTLYHHSELITLRIDDLVTPHYAVEDRHNILLRKSKVDQAAKER